MLPDAVDDHLARADDDDDDDDKYECEIVEQPAKHIANVVLTSDDGVASIDEPAEHASTATNDSLFQKFMTPTPRKQPTKPTP